MRIFTGLGIGLKDMGVAESDERVLVCKNRIEAKIKSAIEKGNSEFSTVINNEFGLWFAEAVASQIKNNPDKKIYLFVYFTSPDVKYTPNTEARIKNIEPYMSAKIFKANAVEECFNDATFVLTNYSQTDYYEKFGQTKKLPMFA